jgi:hypothetical protein
LFCVLEDVKFNAGRNLSLPLCHREIISVIKLYYYVHFHVENKNKKEIKIRDPGIRNPQN